jgi:type I restriction enzyme, S subunit
MIPEGWNGLFLGDLFNFKNGLNGEKSLYGAGAKFVNVMDVFRGPRLRHSEIVGEMAVSSRQLAEFAVKQGDVLFNRTSETDDEIALSTVYLDTEPAVFGGFVIRARPNGKALDQDFCIYILQADSIRREMIRRGQGAIRSNIGQADLATVPVLLPPLPEQRRIAEILATWDRAIETVEALIANARAQKKALMQSLLTGKHRLPGFEGEWIEMTLDKIAKVTMGSSPPSTSYNELGEGLPLIQGNADVKNRVSAPRVHTSMTTQQCLPDDILFSVRAPVGEIAISLHHACIGRGIAAIQARSKNDAEFLYCVLLFAEPGWATLSQGSTFQAVNSKDLKGFTFPAPTNATERQQIGHVVGEAQKAELLLRAQLTALRQEKSALMQQLLTGKRRVKVIESEAA